MQILSIDPGIVLVVGTFVVVAGTITVWFIMRRRLPPEVVAEIAALIAEIRAGLGTAVDEETIITLAGWVYDNLAGNASSYFSREQFIDLVLDVLRRGPDVRGAMATGVRNALMSQTQPAVKSGS